MNGNVQINDTKGDVEALSTNGEVILSNVDGYVIAQTSNGNIDVRGTTGIGDLKTSNGVIFAEVTGYSYQLSMEMWTFTNLMFNVSIEIRSDQKREV